MSTAYTIQRLFQQVPDMSLRIGEVGYTRPLQIGGDWTRIRLGILCSIDATATVYGSRFFVGLCSSFGPPVASYSTLRFIGASLAGAPASDTNWTYAAGAGFPYFSGSGNVYAFTKRLTNYPQSVNGSAVAYIAQTYPGTKNRRSPIFVDISRGDSGSGAATVTVYGCSSATVAVDYRPDHLEQGFDQLGTPVVNGQTMTTLVSSSALLIGEETGVIDSFDLFWSRNYTLLDVYALGAAVSYVKPTTYVGDKAVGAFESFDIYSNGTDATLASLVGPGLLPFVGSGTIGTAGWTGAGTILGSPNVKFSPPGWYGTIVGNPIEQFEDYTAGTFYAQIPFPSGGQGWSGSGTILGA